MRNEIELPEREDDFEEDVSVEDVAEAIAEETPEAPKNAEAQKRVQKIGYADRPVAVVSVRITNADWKVIRKLRDIYDVFKSQDALRIAIYDALEYQNQLTEQRAAAKDANEKAQAELSKNLTLLKEEVAALRDELSKAEEEEEVPEEAAPYNEQAIDYFDSLDDKGKQYLAKALHANPNNRYVGNHAAYKREIDVAVQKLCPYSNNHRDISKCQQERHDLLGYLIEEGILPE